MLFTTRGSPRVFGLGLTVITWGIGQVAHPSVTPLRGGRPGELVSLLSRSVLCAVPCLAASLWLLPTSCQWQQYSHFPIVLIKMSQDTAKCPSPLSGRDAYLVKLPELMGPQNSNPSQRSVAVWRNPQLYLCPLLCEQPGDKQI